MSKQSFSAYWLYSPVDILEQLFCKSQDLECQLPGIADKLYQVFDLQIVKKIGNRIDTALIRESLVLIMTEIITLGKSEDVDGNVDVKTDGNVDVNVGVDTSKTGTFADVADNIFNFMEMIESR